ncbi:spore coat U domain-containing protein [Actibacterium sp. MT2.3-13A]|uniref:Csu type fimbrial protein n=1 Tax=Actibacterium sp. MT2.3-13A TaxID=2828332 RepID=UPI001BA903BC|nr:spore coat U domain-containing protein [Actibacterium sp. MT2.3-13A]
MTRRLLHILLAGALNLIAALGAAQAQDCAFSATGLDFGAVDTLSSGNVDTFGTITISCPALLSSASGTISIGDGSGGATASARQMTSGGTATALDYQLYTDAARTIVAGTAPANRLSFDSGLINILGSSAALDLYGRVFGGQSDVAPGSYLSQFGAADVVIDYTTCTLLLVCTNRAATLSFDVTAGIAANCAVSATDLDFGPNGVLSGSVDGTSTVSVLCTPQTAFQIGLDNGLTGSAPASRLMTNPNGHSVSYGLYRDASRNLSWGSTLNVDTGSGTGDGTSTDFTVYGWVPAQATPPAGVYSDTVVVTVTY